MSRYYGFTIDDIKAMTLHQFGEYMKNVHLFERLSTGEKPEESETYNESEIEDIARDHGINIPER